MALSSSLRRISCQLIKQSSLLRATHIQPCLSSHIVNRGFRTTPHRLNEHIINIQDDEDFKDRVMKNTKPVIVDFHAVWCGPCKLLGPRLESLIASKAGSVLMAKVDIDENSDLALDHGVEAVPTVLAVKDGKVVDKFIGLKDDAELQSFVNKLTGE